MLNIALQLYTVRDECEKDFLGTIARVAEIGYKGLEFCGFYGVPANTLKSHIDKLGLKAVCAHRPLPSLMEDLDGEIEYAKTIGMNSIAVPWLPDEYRKDADAFMKTGEMVREVDEKCKKAGIQLCYHNHDFEFIKINDEYVLDIYLKMAPNMMLELDTFWTSYAGIDTLGYMDKNAAKLLFVHLKDMIKGPKPDFAEVGEGCLDELSFIKAAVKYGVEWAVVEQDVCRRPSLESATISFNNIKRMMAGLR